MPSSSIYTYTITMFQANNSPFVVILLFIFRNFVCRKPPQDLLSMSVKVYVISEPLAIDFIVDDDIDGFQELLDSDDTLYFPEPEIFDSGKKPLRFVQISVTAQMNAPCRIATRSALANLPMLH